MKIITPAGRMSFPTLFEPKAQQAGQAEKYSVTLLIPKDGGGKPGDDICNLGQGSQKMSIADFINGLRSAVASVVAEKWPDPAKRPAKFKSAIKDGDTVEFDTGAMTGKLKKDKYPEFAGCWVISASANASKSAPSIVDALGKPVTDTKQAYPGRWARMSLNLYAYDNVNVGIGCGLLNVQLLRDDEAFGGGHSDPTEDFGAMFTEATAAQQQAAVDFMS